jgi:hypothetical protein
METGDEPMKFEFEHIGRTEHATEDDRRDAVKPMLAMIKRRLASKPLCQEAGCISRATMWRGRDDKVLCAVHGATTKLERLQARLDAASR